MPSVPQVESESAGRLWSLRVCCCYDVAFRLQVPFGCEWSNSVGSDGDKMASCTNQQMSHLMFPGQGRTARLCSRSLATLT